MCVHCGTTLIWETPYTYFILHSHLRKVEQFWDFLGVVSHHLCIEIVGAAWKPEFPNLDLRVAKPSVRHTSIAHPLKKTPKKQNKKNKKTDFVHVYVHLCLCVLDCVCVCVCEFIIMYINGLAGLTSQDPCRTRIHRNVSYQLDQCPVCVCVCVCLHGDNDGIASRK